MVRLERSAIPICSNREPKLTSLFVMFEMAVFQVISVPAAGSQEPRVSSGEQSPASRREWQPNASAIGGACYANMTIHDG